MRIIFASALLSAASAVDITVDRRISNEHYTIESDPYVDYTDGNPVEYKTTHYGFDELPDEEPAYPIASFLDEFYGAGGDQTYYPAYPIYYTDSENKEETHTESESSSSSSSSDANEPGLDEEETVNVGSAPATGESGMIKAGEVSGSLEDKDYLASFVSLYPFSAVDFFITETRPTGTKEELGPHANVKTYGKDRYESEKPEECDDCRDLYSKLRDQQREIDWLRTKYYRRRHSHDDQPWRKPTNPYRPRGDSYDHHKHEYKKPIVWG